MKPLVDIFHHTFHHNVRHAKWPLSFEAMGQAYGLLFYQTIIQDHFADPALLKIQGLHDRGYIYVNGNFRGILTRMSEIYSMPLSINRGQKLQIIVENQGRICYGANINDLKGIVSNVTIDGKDLENWKMASLPMDLNALNELQKTPFETR